MSVAILATAFTAGTVQTQISGLEDVNEGNYLRAIADHIVSGYGIPINWGSNSGPPANFGLAASNSAGLYTLDVDKISRLNSGNGEFLSYPEVSAAARLSNIALGISVCQMLSIDIELFGNTTLGDITAYTFRVSVSQDSGPTVASLNCYVVAKDFLGEVYNETQSDGVGYVTVQVPNASNGTALLAAFARVPFDDRRTSFALYSFAHLSPAPAPNETFLHLSPLNYTLTLSLNSPATTTISGGYAFSYTYKSNLTSTSNSTYAIPALLDNSPTVLVVQGVNGTASFAEWTSYPQVPLEFGSDFAGSEENVFVYLVTVKGTLYKLTMRFGDVIK